METGELVDKDGQSAGSVSVVPVPVRRLECLLSLVISLPWLDYSCHTSYSKWLAFVARRRRGVSIFFLGFDLETDRDRSYTE